MLLQEFNYIYDILLESGRIDKAMELADKYPELMQESIKAYSEWQKQPDVKAAYEHFKKIVYKREGEEGIQRLESYNSSRS